MKFFNTMTRTKEDFTPVHDGEVRLYTCGPTVYSRIHIGNFKTFLFEDILVRYFIYKGYKVKQVMNITDIDDKTIRTSRQRNVSLREVTDPYIELFHKDRKTLHIIDATNYPRATEHVPQMVEIVQKLMDNGHAYRAADNSIYYSISSFKDYGKLAHLEINTLQSGASGRVASDEYEKDSISDFALWKAWDENDGEVYWETQLGKGRPGWHIECSAMSMEYLGETLDIHTGGIDNIFPHHQNEIAQSEGFTGKTFSKYWMHSYHLMVDGAKMSKSLGNFYTLEDLEKKGISPETFRFFVVTNHYRTSLNYTDEAARAAGKARDSLIEFVDRVRNIPDGPDKFDVGPTIEEMFREFEAGMDDDLNTPQAIAAVFDMTRPINRAIDEGKIGTLGRENLLKTIEKVNTVFAFIEGSQTTIPEEVIELMKQREQVRKEKNWAMSDQLRDKILELGFIVKDTPQGQRVTKK
ncbi:MAG TPA: cysteine--tRNA ligase [Caldisericia bacterium]|nr:cysteine--tRNA ligase [Caldisericia bacterium]HOU08456.1 cysteine--tRNA ligase [Caldisericia bacterium]HPL89365.1 cysteine--tRNA ligase [Caldisericia bacterium]HQG59163.1 cysteine--tRNA ligase [Caldisericia bacterium]HQH48314.1 cysteine--tRNA ligase [Caldisericia bacterium]